MILLNSLTIGIFKFYAVIPFIVIKVIFLVHNEEKDSPANKRDKSANDDEPLNPGKIPILMLTVIHVCYVTIFYNPQILCQLLDLKKVN